MKPFDLQAALSGEPVQTRDGAKVAFIAHDKGAPEHRRVLFRLADAEHYFYAHEDGALTHAPGCRSDRDLGMATKTREVWVNVFIGGGASWHDSQASADALWTLKGKPGRFGNKARRIEIEE